MMRKQSEIPPHLIQDYWRLFVNRRAYTLQSSRPHPETGGHYYFRPSDRRTGVPLELDDRIIRRLLRGEITIGLYAINPENQSCKWVAIDADYKNSMDDLLKLQYQLGQDGIEPALEMSRRGGHLWIFFAEPLLAKPCRIYIHDIALRLGVPVKGAELREGIEIFPKQDAIGPGEFGNAIRAQSAAPAPGLHLVSGFATIASQLSSGAGHITRATASAICFHCDSSTTSCFLRGDLKTEWRGRYLRCRRARHVCGCNCFQGWHVALAHRTRCTAGK